MMARRKSGLVAALLVVGVLVVGIIWWVKDQREPEEIGEPVLTVQFTCDTRGRLEPCGCFVGQHGGLTRLRTYLEGKELEGEKLRLDVGGAIAGTADYEILKYPYLLRAYGLMNFSALNMGGREAGIPAKTLRELAADSPVPMLSASLVDPGSRELILVPNRVVEIEGRRIGIVGVVSPKSVTEPGAGVAVLGLAEAIDRQLIALEGKTDLNILLAFADEAELRQIARDYYEFALVLGGDVAGPTQDVIRENDSLIAYTTNQARTLGTLTARLGGAERTRLLDPVYDIRLLEESIPHDKELLAYVKGYREEIRRTPLEIDDEDRADPHAIPGVSRKATYVGSESCQTCHQEAHKVWADSGHAHAFATLEEIGAEADPNCIGCHTVGFGEKSGYRRPLGNEKLVDVSCESCHGPASEHLTKVLEGQPNQFKFRPLGPGDCTKCHYGEFSRPFDWATFWPMVEH